MQRLPAESLGCIFVACLPDEPYVRPARDRAPLLLVEVCRRWREVARQTPQLWRSLDAIQDHGWGELGVVNWEDMDNFETWLSRSGNRPLSLGLSFSDDANFRDDWMELVQSYRERFWRLRIVDGDRVDLNQLLDGAHMLQHLAVQALFEEGDRVVAVTQPLPRLKTLVLDLLHASPGTLRDAGWANLTRLAVRLPEVVSYEVEKFLILLDRCPNLIISFPTQRVYIFPWNRLWKRLSQHVLPPECAQFPFWVEASLYMGGSVPQPQKRLHIWMEASHSHRSVSIMGESAS